MSSQQNFCSIHKIIVKNARYKIERNASAKKKGETHREKALERLAHYAHTHTRPLKLNFSLLKKFSHAHMCTTKETLHVGEVPKSVQIPTIIQHIHFSTAEKILPPSSPSRASRQKMTCKQQQQQKPSHENWMPTRRCRRWWRQPENDSIISCKWTMIAGENTDKKQIRIKKNKEP